MIRRITKHNDLKDFIKSCPSGVIDDIYEIRYFIQGHPEYITAEFTKSGNELVVILPTSQLELLPNGILMRRAFYKVVDSSYPDGEYNLEFEDNMNIWLGDYVSEEPVIPEYVTEDELTSELSSYATQSWVLSQEYLTSDTLPSDIATMGWVISQSYITSLALTGYATESWVSGQGYLTAVPSQFATQSWVESQGYLTSHQDLTGYATESWVSSQGYLTAVPSQFATQSWVESQGYLTSETIPSDIATQSWVESQGYLTSHQDLSSYATQSWVENQGYLTSHQDLTGYATESWVEAKGYITSENIPSGIATQSWVQSQSYATQSWVLSRSYVSLWDLDVYMNQNEYVTDSNMQAELVSYATQDWVSEQGYLTSHQDLTSYATQSWVQSQGYLTSENIPSGIATQSWVSSNFLSATALNGYATQSWVESQGYLTSHQNLSSYATKQWVSNNVVFYDKSMDIVTGGYMEVFQRDNVNLPLAITTYASTSVKMKGVIVTLEDGDLNAGIARYDKVGSSWVQSWYTPFLTTNNLSSYATQEWVSSNYLSATALNGYATQEWVSEQGYLTSHQDLSSYATQSWVSSQLSTKAESSWVTSNFLETSKVWTGSQSAWELLTAEQQATYIIALITE